MNSLNWYFKRANFEGWEEVTREFQEKLHILIPEFNNDIVTNFRPTKNDLVRDNMPTLRQLLKDVKLYDRWTVTSMIIADPLHPLRAHIDKPGRIYALNWPILNCNETETLWYETPEGYTVENNEVLSLNNNGSKYVSLADYNLKEVDRCIINEPTFLRVDVPHAVYNRGNKVRLCASLRFSPELDTYFC